MIELIHGQVQILGQELTSQAGMTRLFLMLFPFFILMELPVNLVVLSGVVRWHIRERFRTPVKNLYRPKVSCIVTCYSEGPSVVRTLQSLCEQTYAGQIEIIPVIDGAAVNSQTMNAIRQFRIDPAIHPRRRVRSVPKWQRGGRVSSLNAGLHLATGEVVMALDGDTSFDNNMVAAMVPHFADPNVPAVAGALRVRNTWSSLTTMMQAVEYQIANQMAKIGLSEWNIVNNISGAFGAFRRDFLLKIGGWDTHSAEDLDITVRIKSYFGRHQKLRIPFEPTAIGHTDVPVRFRDFLRQRLRWDGDLFFVYIRKHAHSMSPRILGWPNFLMTLLNGFFFQLVLPFLIVGYVVLGLLLLPAASMVYLALLIYGLYFVMALVLHSVYLLMVSERPRQDMQLLPMVVFFPLFMFALRVWTVVATCNEVFRRGHEESSMAPWWVLKRGRRF